MRYQYTSLVMLASLGACAAPISQSEATGETAQSLVSPGKYRITPSYTSSQCLSTVGGNTNNWGSADTWSCSNSPDPDWNVVQISSGVYELRQAASGECLTAANGLYNNGNSLVLWECTGGNGTRWNVIPVGSNYTFQSIDNHNKCIDINGKGTSNGTKVQVWDCSGSSNQQFSFNQQTGTSQIAATISATQTSGSHYSAKVTVTNTTNMTLSNWQVALHLNQSHIDQVPSYGGTTGITNGSVYFNNGLAIVTPANGATLAAGAHVDVTFTGDIDGSSWTPSIASVDGVAGSSVTLANDGIDHVARAAATGALNVVTGWESGRSINNLVDFAVLDSHSYMLSSDGSQIVFDPSGPGGWYATQSAIDALAIAQMDGSVASYLVSGLLSCFADVSPALVYSFNGAALRGWSYTTTAQNITLGTTTGTNNINRVGSMNAAGAEQITLTETVNPNSEDKNFGLASTLNFTDFDTNYNDSVYAKYHGGNAQPCSPFNGPGGPANPYLILSVNGNSVGARQQVSGADCPYVNHCTSTVILDPVAYASPGQFYDGNNNLIGPSSNPFALDPYVSIGYNPDHQGQWAQDVSGNWGQFTKRVFLNGSWRYKWNMCSGGVFNANGC